MATSEKKAAGMAKEVEKDAKAAKETAKAEVAKDKADQIKCYICCESPNCNNCEWLSTMAIDHIVCK